MNVISTKNLSLMPEISSLKKLLKSLALLDAIMSPEWDLRFYSYKCRWDKNEQMGSMRNGCGDEFFILFTESGCFIKGFDHESAMSSWGTDEQLPWKGLLDGLPSDFTAAANEPAFSMQNISFCLWWHNAKASWGKGNFEYADCEDPDGSEYLLEILDGKPETYQTFAQEYYEVELPVNPIRAIYNHASLTEELVKSLNPKITLSELESDIAEIGYPSLDAT